MVAFLAEGIQTCRNFHLVEQNVETVERYLLLSERTFLVFRLGTRFKDITLSFLGIILYLFYWAR